MCAPFLRRPLLSLESSILFPHLPGKPTLKIGISFPLSLTFPARFSSRGSLFPICALSNLFFAWNIIDAECLHNVSPQCLHKKKKKPSWCTASLSDDTICRHLSERKITKAIILNMQKCGYTLVCHLKPPSQKAEHFIASSLLRLVSPFPPSFHCVVFLRRPSGAVSIFGSVYTCRCCKIKQFHVRFKLQWQAATSDIQYVYSMPTLSCGH